MALRRKATSPQTDVAVLSERIARLEGIVKQLRQSGPHTVQPDSHQMAFDPIPWELMLNHPGGHTVAWPSDNYVYWHPGRVDQDTGETIDAGWKRIGGPVIDKVKIFGDKIRVTAGDGALYDMITEDLDKTKLVHVAAFVTTPGSSVTTVQIHNLTRGIDMLSTRVTIDAGDNTSYQAAVPPIILTTPATANPPNKVFKGDVIRYDVDTAGTNAKGLAIYPGWQ